MYATRGGSLLVHAQHHRVLQRRQIQPDDVADLRLEQRVGGERTTPPRQGCTPYSRQARATVAYPTRRCRASSRLDQWVNPYFLGGGRSVAAITARCSTVRGGRPGRGSSSRPAMPRSTYRGRHRSTVGRDTPTRPGDPRVRHPSRGLVAGPGEFMRSFTGVLGRARLGRCHPRVSPSCLPRSRSGFWARSRPSSVVAPQRWPAPSGMRCWRCSPRGAVAWSRSRCWSTPCGERRSLWRPATPSSTTFLGSAPRLEPSRSLPPRTGTR